MRYVINEAHAEFVSIDKEIAYLRSYIELQHVRFGEAVELSFFLRGNTNRKVIAPLILIPFVENAFKHGVNAEEDSVIVINLDVEQDTIQLRVTNNKVRMKLSENEKSGLGIENTKARLELLYPSRYVLNIDDNEKEFKVDLKLTIQ